MPPPRYDFASDPLITVTTGDDTTLALSLPAVLARLGRGAPTEFAALRAHQRAPWHAFVVQLAAIACARGGDTRLDVDEDTWRSRLLSLTGDAHEPWCLVVDDLSKPALLQPPVLEKKLDGFKRSFAQPDALDVLITAKNHDLKSARMDRARPEHWLFALVALQTTEGFLGKGNYGVARMNGGFASRPQVGVARGPGFADRFARDVRTWLDGRDAMIDSFRYDPGGVALLWCEPWDGQSSISLDRLDPFFIEVCRRVRLVSDGDRIVARGVSSEAARVEAKQLLGVTGDIWIPVKKEDPAKALTVSSRGFDYNLVTQLLFSEDYAKAAAQSLRREDGAAPVFVARALARGQGETNGLHERVLEIPAKVVTYLGEPSKRQRLGALATRRVAQAAELRKRALRPALLTLVQGDPAKTKLDDPRVDSFSARFEERVNETFFASLWDDAHLDDEPADASWLKRLVDLGASVLREAIASVPVPSERKWRAEAAAERVFWGSARNNFKPAFSQTETAQREEQPQ